MQLETIEDQNDDTRSWRKFLLMTCFQPQGLLRLAIVFTFVIVGCAVGDQIGGNAKYWGVGIGGGLGGGAASWLALTQYGKKKGKESKASAE